MVKRYPDVLTVPNEYNILPRTTGPRTVRSSTWYVLFLEPEIVL